MWGFVGREPLESFGSGRQNLIFPATDIYWAGYDRAGFVLTKVWTWTLMFLDFICTVGARYNFWGRLPPR